MRHEPYRKSDSDYPKSTSLNFKRLYLNWSSDDSDYFPPDRHSSKALIRVRQFTVEALFHERRMTEKLASSVSHLFKVTGIVLCR